MPTSLSFPPRARHDTSPTSPRHCLIFFITGNPGLIDYYAPFLSTLRSLLDETEARRGGEVLFHVAGRNLSGFDDDDGHAPFGAANPPYGLEAQIEASYAALAAARVEYDDPRSPPRRGTPFDEVIVIGHSVGTYIALEIFHRHMQQQQQQQQQSPNKPQQAAHLHLRLRAAILLFATVTHIARSPHGRLLSALLSTPLLGGGPRLPAAVAAGLLSLVPGWALDLIVRRALGFPPHAASATTRFLRSRDGVWQALHLGADEMRSITEESWAEELWEVSEEAEAAAAPEKEKEKDGDGDGDGSPGLLPPKFFIFFGKDDHWVADECRDVFIARREAHARREGPAHKRGRTRIVVDEGGLPHDFCIRHSEVVAEKVKVWIDEIAEYL